MEIFSMRSSLSLLHKNSSNNAKNTKTDDFPTPTKESAKATFQVDEETPETLDFGAVSPSDLRSYARDSFDHGVIDQDTFTAISEPLPTHAIDALGNVIDLSDVTDSTQFNFQDYYRNQLAVAQSIGDPQQVRTMESIVNFLGA